MKPKQTYIIFGVIFFCLCLFLTGIAIVYFSLQDRPPGALSNSGYYIRRTKVFYYPGFGLSDAFEISSADRDSFVILDERYALDESHVFYGGVPIPDSDPKTFRVLNANFECSADSQFAYYQNNIIQNVDASTLPPDVQVNNCTETELYTNP